MDEESKRGPAFGCSVWTWLLPIGIIVIVLLGMLTLGTPPHGTDYRGKAREAEVRANLHKIQLAIERFAVDTGGFYPEYLIGGAAEYADLQVEPEYVYYSFRNVRDIEDIRKAADPLIRKGYLLSYPKNPFQTGGGGLQRFLEEKDDPLRNGTPEARIQGTRFGPYCSLMGSVLADYRYGEYVATDSSGNEATISTYADFEYPFFDMWEHKYKPKPFLPGSFFYKSAGEVDADAIEEAMAGEPLVPTSVKWYMLGGYGAIFTKGKDILGPEPMLDIDGAKVPAWTRSTMELTDDEGRYLGSPYGTASLGGTSDLGGGLAYGNPNGIPDGIIMVLTPREDWQEATKIEF